MAAKSNIASSNGVSDALSVLQSPAANGFLISQKLALEATRFWLQRAQAYAEQAKTLAACREPGQFMTAQARFFVRMREDYVSEADALKRVVTPAQVESDAGN